jgi:hypothetical protein
MIRSTSIGVLIAALSALLTVPAHQALAQATRPAAGPAALERPVANPVVMSPGYTRAVARGTRTTRGVPGPNYWEQWARYTITARLDVAAKQLAGSTRIVYRNASPDTLRQLWVQVLQNWHRTDASRSRSAEITGGYAFTRVAAQGRPLQPPADRSRGVTGPAYVETGTNLVVVLPAPLAPRDSAVLEFDWSFRIPRQGIGARMGWDGDNLFYLGYFYPQMAVYDDVVGWQTDNFLGTAEFYAGFAEYDVTLDVPQGWLVQGTGRLVNEGDVLPAAVVQRLRLAEASDTVVHVVTQADLDAGAATRTGADGRLRWHFAADSVRDVAFAVTRASLWDVTRSDIGDRNGDGRPEFARAEALYRPAHTRWRQGARYAQHAIAHHSRHTGVPYPYPHATAVEADGIIGGGMEFPMMTIISGYDQAGDTALYSVVSHELGHIWVPMIVSTDERRWGWMDEGTTDYNENRATADFYPGYDGERYEFEGYLGQARTGEESALMRYSDFLDSPNHYGVYAYQKPGSMLITLRHLLGDSTFARAYQGYLRAWAFKQPKPWDFFNAFNTLAGRDLSWFWRTFYFETWVLDQSVASVTAGPRSTTIVVRDLGDAPLPARLTITLANGDTLQREVPLATWLGGARTATVTVPRGREVTRVEIDARHEFPDVSRKNNLWIQGADALPASLPALVRTDLVRARERLVAQGYRGEGDLLSGSLAPRATDSRTVTLQAGVRYAFVVVCDRACADIDTRVLDPSGAPVAEDTDVNDDPVLEFTASTTGAYRLNVIMWDCREATCTWGGQVLRR